MTSGLQEMNTSEFRSLVSSGHRFLETCDGGDIGSIASPSTWLMGVEPGWSLKDQMQREKVVVAASEDLDDDYSVEMQLGTCGMTIREPKFPTFHFLMFKMGG